MITTKINANIGASPVASGTAAEVEKLHWAQQFGADTLMDLSTGGNLTECRQAIIDHATIPIGTVPIYSMIIGRRIEDLTYDVILKEIERQAQQGVDYFTIHAGRPARSICRSSRSGRPGIVSRGGSLPRQSGCSITASRTRCTSSSTRSAPSCASTTSPTRSGTAFVRGVSPTPRRGSARRAADSRRARPARARRRRPGNGRGSRARAARPDRLQHAARAARLRRRAVLRPRPLVTDVFPGYDHITSAIGATEAAATEPRCCAT
jgi:phosphomethylpyrimidine synthase